MIAQPFVVTRCPSRRWWHLRRLACEYEQGHLGRHRATVKITRYETGQEREWVEWGPDRR